MRTLQRTLVLATLATLPACAAVDSDELAGESEADGDDSKADAAGTYTYFEIHRDLRACEITAPHCGGWFVSRVNRAQTRCGTDWAPQCYIADLDFSAAGLDEHAIDKVKTYIDAETAGGARVLMRGAVDLRDFGDRDYITVLNISEAWLAVSDGVADGVFVHLKDSGRRCITAPCEATVERKLNSALTATIADIDFAPTGLTDEDLTALGVHDSIATGDGVIIAGDRYRISFDGRSARARRAEQVFVRMTPPGLPAANP